MKHQYILYAYNYTYRRYVICRRSTNLNKLKNFIKKALKDNPKPGTYKHIPLGTDLNDCYIKHNIIKVSYELLGEEIIIINENRNSKIYGDM